MRIRVCCLILLFMATLIESSEDKKKKVLIYNPFLGYYHTTFMTTIANELHDAGYEVYMLDSLVNTGLPKNDRRAYHEEIEVAQNTKTAAILKKGEESEKGLAAFWDDPPAVDKCVGFFTFFKRKSGFSRMMYHQCKDVLTEINKLKDDKWKDVQFDLGITEFFDFCGVGIFSLLNVSKTMLASSVPLHEHLGEKLGLPRSFDIPTKFSMSTLPELREGFNKLTDSINKNAIESAIIAHETFGHMEKYQTALFREKNSTFDFQALLRSAHSLIENVHPLLDLNEETPQIIRIGGITVRNATFHTDEEKKEIYVIFNAIEDAVKREKKIVLISFGTVMNTTTMKKNTMNNFINALKDVSDAFFIWKTDREQKDMPVNVKASKWLPQNNILSSGKVDLFVSHMGIGSMTEAAYAGVPLLSIPIFVDQHYNYACARRFGIARFVDKSRLAMTSSDLKNAIEDALKDEELKAKSKELKKKLESKDQKKTMMDHIESILSRPAGSNSMNFQTHLDGLNHDDGHDDMILLRSFIHFIRYCLMLFPIFLLAVFLLLTKCCGALCCKHVDTKDSPVWWWFCLFIPICLCVAWPFPIARHIPFFIYFLYEFYPAIIFTLIAASVTSYLLPKYRYVHPFLGAGLALAVIGSYLSSTLGLLLSVAVVASGLRFNVPANQKRCLKEEIHKNLVVTGEYEITEGIGYTASVHVTDTRGHTLYKREQFGDLKGKFAFTADEYDIFEICLTNHAPAGQNTQREFSLVMKHGVEAKNYDDIAKAEHLKPLEVELRRLEDLSDAIVKDFAFMRQREEEMRNTNESTNSRVLYLSIFSMLCLLGLAAWQVLFLRSYFKAKKLID